MLFSRFKTDKYIFLHIPKTAGTTLNDIFVTNFGKNKVSAPFGSFEFDLKMSKVYEKFDVISGHIGWKDVEKYYPDRKKIIFFREPLDRCLSWYYFVRSRSLDSIIPLNKIKYDNDPREAISIAKQVGLEEFLTFEHPHIIQNIHDRQAWQIASHGSVECRDVARGELLKVAQSHLNNTDFIGLLETFNEDLVRIAKWMGMNEVMDIPRKNVTKKRESLVSLSCATIDKLRSINEVDALLYKMVVERRREMIGV